MKKKLIALGAITFLLAAVLALSNCDTIFGCDNNNQCKWEYKGEGLGATNQSGGYCSNSAYKSGGNHCVIFDYSKGLEAQNNQKTVPCNCQ